MKSFVRTMFAAFAAWQRLTTTLLVLLAATSAQALTITAVGSDGATLTDFRWIVEEDTTKPSIPGRKADGTNLALSFHASYMPVVATGETPNRTVNNLDPNKRYFVSVLPRSGYNIGGAPVAGNQPSVAVSVGKTPIPTAQVSVFVFEDNNPVNGVANLPQELGLGGFNVVLSEAGGTYGQSGGQVTKDAFGNPLGSSYARNPDGSFRFNSDGSPTVLALGSGALVTGPDGTLLIKYLYPAKYTVTIIPPTPDWHQTSTIEGTAGIDAWVKANEPTYFQEFGTPGHHVDFGFVRATNDTSVLNGTSTITGTIVNIHNSRPPDYTFFNGPPIPKCWIGLNETPATPGRALFTAPCNADSSFSIPNVPAGQYQLVIWDDPLDVIIASTNVTVPPGGGTVDLQEVAVFNWFGRMDHFVFFDSNQNGFPDGNEVGLPGVNINLRFRDGSIYQSQATRPNGWTTFQEVFPFFNWLIAEVDYARFKATGATTVVDNGGAIPPHSGWAMPSYDRLTPQPQFCMQADIDAGVPECPAGSTGQPRTNPNTGNNLSKTDTGPVLLNGFQLFLGQNITVNWGKGNYRPGENGGITGITHYATTRAEDEPRYAAAENWEPGIPRVQVNLYRDCNNDGIADVPDPNSNGCLSFHASLAELKRADVDNYPFGWSTGGSMGPEDVKRNTDPGFSLGDAIKITTADSWDDNLPAGCQGDTFTSNGYTTDCYDGLRNFNQARPAVFDGGFAFGEPYGDPELPPGHYIVEAVAPPGYLHQGNGDKNVDFGVEIAPSPLLLPPECVGEVTPVPQYLRLFRDQNVENPNYAPGKTWAKCDMKRIDVAQGRNAAVDFHFFTEVPVAGHIAGFILDDRANEFDPNAPTFGEKYAPPWIPISVQDWTGEEIQRVYSDQWGTYNMLVPSTFTINPPFPSGVMPNMLTVCINSPGPIRDTRAGSPTLGQFIVDPYFQRQYSQFCYTFQYMPGKTTYLDTPVIPVAAFAGPNQFPVDCELEDASPVIYSVEGRTSTGASQNGPYVPTPSNVVANQPRLVILSAGKREVPNPAYGQAGAPQSIVRDFGFGAAQGSGSVTLGSVTLPVISWNNDMIVARVPNSASTGQLAVNRSNGKSSVMGVTVTVGGPTPRLVMPGGRIQDAIDAATKGELILVPPGTYNELVVMYKQVRLQGWGALSTVINAAKTPAEKLQLWRAKVGQLYSAGAFDLVPGQNVTFDAPNNEPSLFTTEEGPGVIVMGKASGSQQFVANNNARIDGITITGGDSAGGIFVSGYAHYLEISNDKILSNNGFYGGGIRIGHPLTLDNAQGPLEALIRGGYSNNANDNVYIHNNHIALNGEQDPTGTGGGVAICNGSDNYRISRNWICGNYATGNGAGIGHLGLSLSGEISNNTIVFNQSFDQGSTTGGGGIFVGGQAPLVAGDLSPGSGGVRIVANLVQGNHAGGGDGGGILLRSVNGLDVSRMPNVPILWYNAVLQNNMIVNNVAGLAGGGVSISDTIGPIIANNTIANNDSTATAGAAFAANSPNQSTPQPAGFVSRAYTAGLYNAIGTQGNAAQYKKEYSDPPNFVNNIFWHNRGFYFVVDDTATPPYRTIPDIGAGQPAVYSDLAVLGTSHPGTFPLYNQPGVDKLSAAFSIMTNIAGYTGAGLSQADPQFALQYFNGNRNQIIIQPGFTTTFDVAVAFDEGGNAIDVHYGPLTLWKLTCPVTGTCANGDYHVSGTSPALGVGTLVLGTTPLTDFDGQSRPRPLLPARPDIGADERGAAGQP